MKKAKKKPKKVGEMKVQSENLKKIKAKPKPRLLKISKWGSDEPKVFSEREEFVERTQDRVKRKHSMQTRNLNFPSFREQDIDFPSLQENLP
jgi:hypothetical protein